MELKTTTVKDIKELLKDTPDDFEIVIFWKSGMSDNIKINVNQKSKMIEIFCND